jgi:hypothetical protein
MMSGYPARFARVSHYAKWIDSGIRMHSQYSKSKRSKKSHSKDSVKDRDKDNLKGGKKGVRRAASEIETYKGHIKI